MESRGGLCSFFEVGSDQSQWAVTVMSSERDI